METNERRLQPSITSRFAHPRPLGRSWSSSAFLVAVLALADVPASSSYDFTGCCGSKLKHWFDFSDTNVYGSSEVTKISGFTDKMGNSASNTVNGNVQYKVNVQNGLNAIYTDAETGIYLDGGLATARLLATGAQTDVQNVPVDLQ